MIDYRNFCIWFVISICIMTVLMTVTIGLANYTNRQRFLADITIPDNEKSEFDAFVRKDPTRFKTLSEAVAAYTRHHSQQEKEAEY